MISVACENLCLSFGQDSIIDRLTFSLNEGERLGIVGVNGAGKTSLFRLITGEYQANEGNIYIAKDKTIGTLAQENAFDEENTLLDEMMQVKADLINMEAELETLRRDIENGNHAAGGIWNIARAFHP
jgi:ATP-binding cassette subfamily F protein 3